MSKTKFMALLLPALLLSFTAANVSAAGSGAVDSKKLAKAANAKPVKKAQVLAKKKSVQKMESIAKKKQGRGYGADEDMAFAICGLTAEMGAQVMIDAAKDVPLASTIENVKAGEIFKSLPAEVTGDAEFNKTLEQSAAEMRQEIAGNPEYRDQIKDMQPEVLKLGLFVACMGQ